MSEASDFDVDVFVGKQRAVFNQAMDELMLGNRQSDWVNLIFPSCVMTIDEKQATQFFISSLPQARAFFAHKELGPALIEATHTILLHGRKPLSQILGEQHVASFQSCMTIFNVVNQSIAVFKEALDVFFGGKACDVTLSILDANNFCKK